MVSIVAEPDKIIVSGAESWMYGILNGIPAASKRRDGSWWYPPSPFALMRLAHRFESNDIEHQFGKSCAKLALQADRMRRSLVLGDHESKCPYETTTRPWGHQERASAWLANRPFAYLAMKMGTGKTLVAINEILKREARRTLIMCPKSVIDVWIDEFSRHTDIDFCFAAPQKWSSQKKAEYAAERLELAGITKQPFVAIFNYETAWREQVAKFINQVYWDIIIADEGHKLKSAGSRISRFAAKLWRRSAARFLLSGTPLPNNQLDAYGQFRFMDPGVFGTNFARFRSRYAEVVNYKGFDEIVKWKRQDEFKKIFSLTMFRVDEDVLDLPPITYIQRDVTLPAKAMKIYRELMFTFISDVEAGEVTAANALVRLLKFQQITSGFITTDDGETQWLHKEKRQALEDIIDGVSEEPVVVFCRFRNDLSTVREVAEGAGRVYGEVSGSGNVLEGGRIPGGIDVLGVQIQAGGVGVNLNASRLCVFYSLGFSLAEYEQAVARLHRGGQENPVTVYHLVARDTVDEQVYGALAAKKKVVDAIMDFVKAKQRNGE